MRCMHGNQQIEKFLSHIARVHVLGRSKSNWRLPQTAPTDLSKSGLYTHVVRWRLAATAVTITLELERRRRLTIFHHISVSRDLQNLNENSTYMYIFLRDLFCN